MWFETAVTRRMPQWLTTTLPVLDCLWLEKVKAHRWRRWETTPFSMATLSLKGGPASFHLLTIHTKLWQTRWGKGPHSRQPRSLHWNKLKETDQPTQPRGTCHSLPSPSLLGQGHRDASTSIERQQLKLFAKATHVVVVVEWLYYSKRRIIVRWADLSDFFVDFRRKNVYFCFTSNEHCHFCLENGETPKRVVDFPRERDTFRNNIMEIVEDFVEKSYNNNGKLWKS